jgi:hypothetical protein
VYNKLVNPVVFYVLAPDNITLILVLHSSFPVCQHSTALKAHFSLRLKTLHFTQSEVSITKMQPRVVYAATGKINRSKKRQKVCKLTKSSEVGLSDIRSTAKCDQNNMFDNYEFGNT